MAGNWIKMGVGLRTHPKVVRMASALKADRLRVIGGLHAVWSIFDAHTEEGSLEGYTHQAIDADLGWKGFAKAMQDVGWLVFDESGAHVPGYSEHNGATAKRRAMEASRKGSARKKSASNASTIPQDGGMQSGQASASDADRLRNREEKRREEPTNTTAVTGSSIAPDLARKAGGRDHPQDASFVARMAEDCSRAKVSHSSENAAVIERWAASGATPSQVSKALTEARAPGSMPEPRELRIGYVDVILARIRKQDDEARKQVEARVERTQETIAEGLAAKAAAVPPPQGFMAANVRRGA